MLKHIELSIRLVICCNGIPAGARLSRNLPLPHWENSYALDDMETARVHLERLQKYLKHEKNQR